MARPTHIAVNLLLSIAVTMQPGLAYGLQQDCSAEVSMGYTCQGCGCCKVQSTTAKCPCCIGEAMEEEAKKSEEDKEPKPAFTFLSYSRRSTRYLLKLYINSMPTRRNVLFLCWYIMAMMMLESRRRLVTCLCQGGPLSSAGGAFSSWQRLSLPPSVTMFTVHPILVFDFGPFW